MVNIILMSITQPPICKRLQVVEVVHQQHMRDIGVFSSAVANNNIVNKMLRQSWLMKNLCLEVMNIKCVTQKVTDKWEEVEAKTMKVCNISLHQDRTKHQPHLLSFQVLIRTVIKEDVDHLLTESNELPAI